MKDTIAFNLNGTRTLAQCAPDMTVLDYLRNIRRLTGTKEGCAEGDCGACTIIVERAGSNGGQPVATNSCILTMAHIDGAAVTTIEGLTAAGHGRALQDAMASNGASQCGFCTPGFVMAGAALLTRNATPQDHDIHEAIAGNLCRCTGYKPIVEAIAGAGRIDWPSAPMDAGTRTEPTKIGDKRLYRPQTLDELLALRADMPDAVLLAGGTDLGVARAAYESAWDTIIATDSVVELRRLEVGASTFSIGAAATWSEVIDAVEGDYPSFATMLKRFGSTQIRAMGTIGGNLGTASPIGDGAPALIALDATITLASRARGERTMPLDHYFLDYRKTELAADEVIVRVEFPRATADRVMRVWKVSKRYDQDISTVCGAFCLHMAPDGTIAQARLAYGGMAAIPKRAARAEVALTGKALDSATFDAAVEMVREDFKPLSDWRGSTDYRLEVASGLVRRLSHDLAGERVEVMA